MPSTPRPKKSTTTPSHPDVAMCSEITSSSAAGPAPQELTDEQAELIAEADSPEQQPDSPTQSPAPAPTMAPPGTTLGESAAASPATLSGQRITIMYAEQGNGNAWIHLETAGWRKLDQITDYGSTLLTMLSAHCRVSNKAPYIAEDGGVIGTMWVW